MNSPLLILALLGLSACATPSRVSPRRLLAELYTAQKQYPGQYADATHYGQLKARQAHLFPRVGVGDTLFLLERVADIGAPLISAYLWDNHRQQVTKYESYPVFGHQKFPYSTFDDPLRSATERLDSVRLRQLQHQILDFPIVYISRLYRGGVDTYRFRDVTPFDYNPK